MILSSAVSLETCADAAADYTDDDDMRLSDYMRPAFNIITFCAYFCTVGISMPCICDDLVISVYFARFLTFF